MILPETDSSARWEGFDKPLLTSAMQAEGLNADIQNAQGDEQKFATLADGMISSGVKVLVIASISSESGAAVAATDAVPVAVSAPLVTLEDEVVWMPPAGKVKD